MYSLTTVWLAAVATTLPSILVGAYLLIPKLCPKKIYSVIAGIVTGATLGLQHYWVVSPGTLRNASHGALAWTERDEMVTGAPHIVTTLVCAVALAVFMAIIIYRLGLMVDYYNTVGDKPNRAAALYGYGLWIALNLILATFITLVFVYPFAHSVVE